MVTPVVAITTEARTVVRDAIAQEPDPDHLALWLEVRGVQDGVFVYDLYFQALADAAQSCSCLNAGASLVRRIQC